MSTKSCANSGASKETVCLDRRQRITSNVITILVIGVLLAAGAAFLAYGGVTGSLPFMIAGSVAAALSIPPLIIRVFFSLRLPKVNREKDRLESDSCKLLTKKRIEALPEIQKALSSDLFVLEVDQVLNKETFCTAMSRHLESVGFKGLFNQEQKKCFRSLIDQYGEEEIINFLNTKTNEEIIEMVRILDAFCVVYKKEESNIAGLNNMTGLIKHCVAENRGFVSIFLSLPLIDRLRAPDCFLYGIK